MDNKLETMIDCDGERLTLHHYNNYSAWVNKNNLFHRLNGPAIFYKDNSWILWYKNGYPHRENGPAIYLKDESYRFGKEWYYEGKFIKCESQEEFERILKLKLFW